VAKIYLDKQSIEQLIKAFNQRDLEPGSKLFTEDIVLHCPGKSRISGDYVGKTSVVELWKKQISVTNETFQTEFLEVSQGEGILVLIIEISAQLNDRQHSWQRVNHYKVAEGRVVEGWIYEGDQYTADIVFA